MRYIFPILCTLFLNACNAKLDKTTSEAFKFQISGTAQGTTYSVVYYDLRERNFKPAMDSVLMAIDQSVSTYLQGSCIDRWNKSDTGALVDRLFLEVLFNSWNVYKTTNGAFDPTIKPLVTYWGFGSEQFAQPDRVDQRKIDSLRVLVDFDTLRLWQSGEFVSLDEFQRKLGDRDSVFLQKPMSAMQLDFNAIAQGWSADKMAEHLVECGVDRFFIELGGEIVAGFPKPDGDLWRFGIDKPLDPGLQRQMQAIVNLRNRGLATSGSYRKFYERNGKRFSHTINPATGFPVDHGLLSATVVSESAGTADAFATAFMVMGADSTLSFLRARPYLGSYVYLISADSSGYQTYASPQLIDLIEQVEEAH